MIIFINNNNTKFCQITRHVNRFLHKKTWFLFSVSRCTNAMYTMQLTTVWAAAARHEDFPVALGNSAVFTCIGALGNPSRTGPLARKYLPGFPYS